MNAGRFKSIATTDGGHLQVQTLILRMTAVVDEVFGGLHRVSNLS
ncbi:MAG TPA: hypothetical protein VHZ07_23205 [Bryobacteraceae bacterium]|nr:hypothetical protein [Bryobacteraceae bacterium]